MRDFLGGLWAKVQAKLSTLTPLVVSMADAVKIKVAAGDIEGAREVIHETREALDQGLVLCEKLDAALADGSLSMTELAGAAVELQKFLDEAEDVAKGADEDDPPAVTP